MNRCAAVMTTLALLASGALGGELNPEHVPADTRLLAHLDVEAIARSRVFQLIRKDGGVSFDLDEIHQELGLDPFEDIRSITLYNTTDSTEGLIGLIAVNESIDAALERLQSEKGYRTVSAEGIELHVYADGDEEWYGYVERGGRDNLLLIGDELRPLLEAIWVVKGRSPSLADSPDGPALGPGLGSVLYLRAKAAIADLAGIEPASRIARLARSFTFDVGEHRGTLFADLTLETSSTDNALQIHDVLQGAIALVRIAGGMDGESRSSGTVRRLLGALDLQRSGNDVSVHFRYDTEVLVEELQGLDED